MQQLPSRAQTDKTEATHSSGTSVGFQRTTSRYIPEGRILRCFIDLLTFILVNKKWFPVVNPFFNVCSPVSIGMEPIFDYFLFSVIPFFYRIRRYLLSLPAANAAPSSLHSCKKRKELLKQLIRLEFNDK
jgi:hypothetical protein